MRVDAEASQKRWGCPFVTGRTPQPGDEKDLDEECRQALADVTKLTGVTGIATCPRAYTRQPWVAQAVAARNWLEHGCLIERIGYPSAAMVQAIDRLDHGYAERLEYEREQSRIANGIADDDDGS